MYVCVWVFDIHVSAVTATLRTPSNPQNTYIYVTVIICTLFCLLIGEIFTCR